MKKRTTVQRGDRRVEISERGATLLTWLAAVVATYQIEIAWIDPQNMGRALAHLQRWATGKETMLRERETAWEIARALSDAISGEQVSASMGAAYHAHMAKLAIVHGIERLASAGLHLSTSADDADENLAEAERLLRAAERDEAMAVASLRRLLSEIPERTLDDCPPDLPREQRALRDAMSRAAETIRQGGTPIAHDVATIMRALSSSVMEAMRPLGAFFSGVDEFLTTVVCLPLDVLSKLYVARLRAEKLGDLAMVVESYGNELRWKLIVKVGIMGWSELSGATQDDAVRMEAEESGSGVEFARKLIGSGVEYARKGRD